MSSDGSNLPDETFFVLLLIDDNRELSETLAEFLSLKGYAVQCAANGREAIQEIADSHTRPALIFLDLKMPVLDGWGFLAERTRAAAGRCPGRDNVGVPRCYPASQGSGAVAVVRKQ